MAEADSRQTGTREGSPSKAAVHTQEKLLQKEKPRIWSRGSPGGGNHSAHVQGVTG